MVRELGKNPADKTFNPKEAWQGAAMEGELGRAFVRLIQTARSDGAARS